MITVKYFGNIAEKTNCLEEVYSIDTIGTAELIANIKAKHQLEHQTFSIAVNQKIVDYTTDIKLNTQDVVAFLPPFAGG
jgi:sulfur-carrier protein